MSLAIWKGLNKVFPSLNLDIPNENYEAVYLATRDFPSPEPQGKGTANLCERCLTLLHHVTIEGFGEGKQLYRSELAHSIFKLDASKRDYRPNPTDKDLRLDGFMKRVYEPQSCVICKNIKILFDTNEKRSTSKADVRITWTLQDVDPKICFRTKFPLSDINVRIEAKQYDQYSITLGSFSLWIEGGTDINGVIVQDNPVIGPLDRPPGESTTTSTSSEWQPEFLSTCGPSTLKMLDSWMTECLESHPICARSLSFPSSTSPSWIPTRLIHVTQQPSPSNSGPPILQARIVEKTAPSDFPTPFPENGVPYISLSHCWGPAPDPRAKLQGRTKTVLNATNHSAWKVSIPLEDLCATAAQTIAFVQAIGFEYVWIDSLCILQDSEEDWRRESATMGDVYRSAWCNLAALWSASDAEGFLNFGRDPRVDFGFHARLPEILGIADPERLRNGRGEGCALLRGRARLTWDFEPAHGGCGRGEVPLLSRAWVFQERHLAKRVIGFSDKAVYWSCDGGTRCENVRWHSDKYASPALRQWKKRVIRIVGSRGSKTEEEMKAEILREAEKFWMDCVKTYTNCKLTKASDRLIALSSIAKDVSAMGMLNEAKYLAGLWSCNLEDQLLWFCAKKGTIGPEVRIFVPPRRNLGDKEYAAPTWSWASVEVPIRPGSVPYNISRKLAFARDHHMSLSTDFEYGIVEAGYIRMHGRLNKVASTGFTSPNNPWVKDPEFESIKINFGFDTSADIETVRKNMPKVRWLPIRMKFSDRDIGCSGLVLAETDEYKKRNDSFIKPGDKVYRRLGHLNFGRMIEHIGKDGLLLREMGCDFQGEGRTYKDYLENFKLREDEFEEFVLM